MKNSFVPSVPAKVILDPDYATIFGMAASDTSVTRPRRGRVLITICLLNDAYYIGQKGAAQTTRFRLKTYIRNAKSRPDLLKE